MPRKKSLDNVPEGFETVLDEQGTPEIMKRVTFYMSPLQLEFFRIFGFRSKCDKKHLIMQRVIKSFMESFPDIVNEAKTNLKSEEME